MFRRTKGSKAEELHRIALKRLTRAQDVRVEYERVRLDEGLKKLDAQFDAWDEEPPQDEPAEPAADDAGEPEEAEGEARPEDADEDDARSSHP